MTQQDDITQRVLTDDEREHLYARYFSHDHPCGRDINALMKDVESDLLSKLRAEGVPVAEPAFYINAAIINPETGRIKKNIQGGLTWSETRVGGWQMPVYAAPVASAPADHGFAPMPPTQDRQPDDIPGYLESDKEWIDRHLNAVRWLIDNHAAIRAALASAPVANERECGNADCGWRGTTERMCGSVGPLCPECGETTEASAPVQPPNGWACAHKNKVANAAAYVWYCKDCQKFVNREPGDTVQSASAPVAGEAVAWVTDTAGATDDPKLAETWRKMGWPVRPLVYGDAAPQASEAVRILFPAHLRKMWSGGEVQAWLDQHQGVTPAKPSAKGSLERYRKWQAERDEAFGAGVKAAADLVKKMVNDYDTDHGSTDPETGTREYPGEGATWLCEMEELEESIRALKQPQADQAASVCSCPSGDGSLRHPCQMHPGADKDGDSRGGETATNSPESRASAGDTVVLPPLPQTIAWATVNPSLAAAVDDLRRTAVLADRQQQAALSATQTEQGERDA